MITRAQAIRRLRRIQALRNFIKQKQKDRETAGKPINGHACKEASALYRGRLKNYWSITT